MSDNDMGGSNLNEMDAFLAWVATGAGAAGNVEVSTFVLAHQTLPIVVPGNRSRWPNMNALKTGMRWASPAVTMTQADAAIATYRAG